MSRRRDIASFARECVLKVPRKTMEQSERSVCPHCWAFADLKLRSGIINMKIAIGAQWRRQPDPVVSCHQIWMKISSSWSSSSLPFYYETLAYVACHRQLYRAVERVKARNENCFRSRLEQCSLAPSPGLLSKRDKLLQEQQQKLFVCALVVVDIVVVIYFYVSQFRFVFSRSLEMFSVLSPLKGRRRAPFAWKLISVLYGRWKKLFSSRV